MFLPVLPVLRLMAANPFAENVRPTEPLPPDLEQASFHLPPGFEVQLVAAEPDIAKPMNLAFDSRGRLWVTTSREYPFPASPDKPARDRIMIFEDFAPDGRARKVTTFADGLNIPIGIYPFRSASTGRAKDGFADGRTNESPSSRRVSAETWKCIAWSIPNIWLFEDTDGDGKADRKEKLYGPFGWERDTHGNNSSFTRGFDGWLYATHGYNNNSDVRGKDGHAVKMNSGNTYRFRLDGTRIEQNTWGQVNPFGLCFDALGNLYSADCHSEPVYQLLRGGYYPSFGKPHDGLGFAPSMIFHEHGSTAISGIVYYEDDLWPEEYRNNIFTGNVMTSRVNRDAVTFTGSTPLANERPDFVSTDDSWFRPVNLQLGPDGALYIADFYNRIIGHYEVPLTHPGRDRERGRIWRVVYNRKNPKSVIRNPGLPEDLNGLIAELGSPNLTRRMLAMHEICDRFPKEAPSRIQRAGLLDLRASSIPANPAGSPPAWNYVHGLWSLERSGALNDRILKGALESRPAIGRVHALRILTERGLQACSTLGSVPSQSRLKTSLRKELLAALNDSNALVQRCAAEVLGAWPSFENIKPLLGLRHRVESAAATLPSDPGSGTRPAGSSDTHLDYVVRKALRDQLKADGGFTRLMKDNLSEPDARAIADVAVAVPSAEAGAFLLRYVQKYSEKQETLANYLRHASRYVPEKELDALASFTRGKFADQLDFQLALFKSIQQGTEQRGASLSTGVRDWGAELAERLLASADERSLTWYNTAVEGMANPANPWFLQKRVSADGDKESWFLCSLPPGGESLTGVLRSQPFTIPSKLSFYLAGHDGYPNKMAQKRNVVRLRAVDTGEALSETSPPRNDTAQLVTWDFTRSVADVAPAGKSPGSTGAGQSPIPGRQGYLEVTDADNGDAYAWLAIGRFEPPVLIVPKLSPNAMGARQLAAAELAGELSLANLETPLARLLASDRAEIEPRAAAARALLRLGNARNITSVIALLRDAASPNALRAKLGLSLVEQGSEEALATVLLALREAPQRLQTQLATALAGRREGAEALLQNVESGKLSPRLLQERQVKDRLLAAGSANAEPRIQKMIYGLTPPSAEIQKLIDERRASFNATKASAARGETVFTLNCRPCHQIDGAGNVVGPQLDGVGGRGLERLLEDVLDPNRNVDPAFHTAILSLRDGEAVSGLYRREEGEAIVLANVAGKDVSIPKQDIAERRNSTTSLMPENFGEVIPPPDFNDLMAFLLAHGPKAEEKRNRN
jgi:putative heme-binding domain-containing protein